jgi:ATP-dependent Clp protease ATP-binding subunit ClpB
MLQLLDDGRLTDSKGRAVDFKNTVVIMTSNLGSQDIAEHALQRRESERESGVQGGPRIDDDERVRAKVTDALRQHFRPEFLNRVDEIIFFHALTRNDMHRIVDIQIAQLARRLGERKLQVELTRAAVDRLVDEGYDPAYGARPLKRTIQRRLLDPLAMRVLQGDFGEGDRVVVDVSGAELQFTRQLPVGA